jgi:hypothetical protein
VRVKQISRRDAEIIRRFQDGEGPDEIGLAVGLAESRVCVALYTHGELRLEELYRWLHGRELGDGGSSLIWSPAPKEERR